MLASTLLRAIKSLRKIIKNFLASALLGPASTSRLALNSSAPIGLPGEPLAAASRALSGRAESTCLAPSAAAAQIGSPMLLAQKYAPRKSGIPLVFEPPPPRLAAGLAGAARGLSGARAKRA